MSDAIAPEPTFTNLYVYPNPVYPTYKGNVVVRGLVADTQVRILDANGNLVKNIQGTGGEVVWDVTNTIGQRVASGIYTILCNSADGILHDSTKVLIIN
jgi:hypothetical protein